jgi:hypothetical protein
MTLAVEEVLKCIPEFKLAGESEGIVRGPRRLPVQFHPTDTGSPVPFFPLRMLGARGVKRSETERAPLRPAANHTSPSRALGQPQTPTWFCVRITL